MVNDFSKVLGLDLTGRRKWNFFIFHFDDFLTTFTKSLLKKPPAFITDLKSSYKLLLSHKDLRSRKFWQWNDGPLKFFWILHGNTFSLFIFIKWKNCCNLPFNDTYKMCCCHLFYSKLKLCKTVVFKLRVVKDMLLDSYFRWMPRQGVARWRRSGVLNVVFDFEISWHIFLLFLLLTLYFVFVGWVTL